LHAKQVWITQLLFDLLAARKKREALLSIFLFYPVKQDGLCLYQKQEISAATETCGIRNQERGSLERMCPLFCRRWKGIPIVLILSPSQGLWSLERRILSSLFLLLPALKAKKTNTTAQK